ncbi:MAG: zinc-ribbon domain-containing protein, partial [Ruminiclostridium sp.]|nr:zinc-ribbon domain-containing protein [Ruminiclostridium sp.]
MYCSKCGTELPESAAFCSNCGQRTGQAAAQTAEQEPVISAYDRQISGTEQEKAAAQ